MSAPPVVSAVLRGIRTQLGALILVGVAINFANVVGRYVFLKPIIWPEEVLVFIIPPWATRSWPPSRG